MSSDAAVLQRDLDTVSAWLRASALETNRFSDALTLARLYGRLHWDNISGWFGDEPFEAALYDQWQGRFASAPASASRNESWCHIISRLYASGGHSRLFRMVAQGLNDRGIAQRVIIADKAPRDVTAGLAPYLSDCTKLTGARWQRAVDVYRQASGAPVVLLHMDPDDIGTALAARALHRDGTRVLFVNHADHVFSFGPGAASVTLEICATGWRTTQDRRWALTQGFMGIPMLSGSWQSPAPRTDRSGPVLSIGGPGKYRPAAELNFATFLTALLERVPNDAVLIGPDGSDDWWAPLRDRYGTRVRFMGVQPPETVQQAFAEAACYVDSFPMDGGTVFSEAVMSGLPAFGPNRASALGISPADSLRCCGVDSLLAEVAAFLGGGAENDRAASVRAEIAEGFTVTAVADRVIAAAQDTPADLPNGLLELGNRGPDYNADAWRARGVLNLPRRMWWRLSPRARLQALRGARRLDLSNPVRKALLGRILLG